MTQSLQYQKTMGIKIILFYFVIITLRILKVFPSHPQQFSDNSITIANHFNINFFNKDDKTIKLSGDNSTVLSIQ